MAQYIYSAIRFGLNHSIYLEDSSLSLKKGSRREVMLGRQEEIKPLGQPGQYMHFPFTSLSLPFLTENELSLAKEGQILYVGIFAERGRPMHSGLIY